MIKKLRNLVIPVLLVLMMFLSVQPASAVACKAEGCYINGTIYRWDTNSGLSGVVVANASNASQTSTTNANGYFNISWYDYSNQTAYGGHNLTITSPSGYVTGYTILKIEIAGNAVSNDTGITRIYPITPTQSAIAAASITKTGATISWTSNISNVGNIITYSMDSALGTSTYNTDWSNSTASPSFALSNLQVNKKWYYQVKTRNIVNNSYSATSSILNFTTLAGKDIDDETPGSYIIPVQTPTSSVLSGGSIMSSIQTSTKPNSNNLTVLILIGVVLYLVFSSGNNKRKR